jgi:hypothetical protein
MTRIGTINTLLAGTVIAGIDHLERARIPVGLDESVPNFANPVVSPAEERAGSFAGARLRVKAA